MDFNISEYYSITPKLAYSTPVYIHSHTRSLTKAVSNVSELKQLQGILSQVRNEKRRVDGLVQQTYQILENKKNELINNQFPTENNKPKKLTKTLRELHNTVSEASNKFVAWSKGDVDISYDHHHSIGVWFLRNKVLESLSDNILDSFIVDQSRKIKNKTGKILLLTSKEISSMSIQYLSKKFKEDYDYDMSPDEIAESLLKRKDFFKVVKDVIKGIPEIKKIYQYDINSLNYSDSIKQGLKAIVSGRSYFSKLGSVFELAHHSPKKQSVTKKQTRSQKKSNAPKITIYKRSMEIVSENKKESDILTTDIKVEFDNLKTALQYGMSLKLNSTRFKSSNNVLTDNDLGSLKPLLTTLNKLQNDEKFRYYVLNVQALSLVQFKESYDTYLTAQEGHRPTSTTPIKDKRLVYIVEEIELMLSQIAFIKAVVGSLYDEEKWDDIGAMKGLPAILSTPQQDYWTSDIILYMMNILKQSDQNKYTLTQFVMNYTPYDPYRDDSRAKDLQNLLVDLYVAKAENAKNTFGDALTYENLTDHFVAEGKNRYEELKSDKKILELLRKINKLNLMINPKRMDKLISKKWTIQFDYSNIK